VTGHRVLPVEGGTDAVGRLGQGVEVNSAGPIGHDDETAPTELDIEALEALLGEEGLNDPANPIGYRHRTSFSRFHTQKRGPQPTPPHLGTSHKGGSRTTGCGPTTIRQNVAVLVVVPSRVPGPVLTIGAAAPTHRRG